MSETSYQYRKIEGESEAPRNPYAVLHVEPFDEEEVDRKIQEMKFSQCPLEEILKLLDEQQGRVFRSAPGRSEKSVWLVLDHPEIVKQQKQFEEEQKAYSLLSPSEKLKKRMDIEFLEKYLNAAKWRTVCKETITRLESARRKNLTELLTKMRAVFKDTAEKSQENPLIIPQPEDLQREILELQQKLPKKKNPLQSEIKTVLGLDQELCEETSEQKRELETIELFFNILGKKQKFLEQIGRRYNELTKKHHPDANSAATESAKRWHEAMFKEVCRAYQELMKGPEFRKKHALELVFNQNTDFWTPEMRAIGLAIAYEFGRLFQLEIPLGVENVACEDCHGHGATLTLNAQEYFPNPRICEACDGEGRIPKGIAEIRKAQLFLLEDKKKSGKKKKKKV